MRQLVLLLIACPLAVLAPPAENDSRTLQALLAEARQRRLAIERPTVPVARTKRSVSHVQVQEERSAKLNQQLADARATVRDLAAQRKRLADTLQDLESQKTRSTTPLTDDQIKQF